MDTPQTVVVETKSSWTSKINWTQAVGVFASIIAIVTGNEFAVSPTDQLMIVAGIQAIQGLVTWVMRTFLTRTILVPSLPGSSAK